MGKPEKIYISENDYDVIDEVIRKYETLKQAELLEGELSRAEVFSDEEMPENVVTLYSVARVLDETMAVEREFTLVPPSEFGAEEGKVSVLAPLGAAVIGLSEGQAIDWPTASGQTRRFRVVKVLYQPEAARRSTRGSTASAKHAGSAKGSRGRMSSAKPLDPVDQASLQAMRRGEFTKRVPSPECRLFGPGLEDRLGERVFRTIPLFVRS